jgi:hypothetical protein
VADVGGKVSERTGGSGLVRMIAPFPTVELSDSPYKFDAVNFTYMLKPHGNKNGEAFKSEIGTEQDAEVIIEVL